MPNNYQPDPKLKFTFGLWTVGNIGRDPFGLPVREIISPVADLRSARRGRRVRRELSR